VVLVSLAQLKEVGDTFWGGGRGAQGLLESSPSYAPIKRLFESFSFCPDVEDITLSMSSESFLEDIEDESTLKILAKQKLVSLQTRNLLSGHIVTMS
jgi:hypothetical protein